MGEKPNWKSLRFDYRTPWYAFWKPRYAWLRSIEEHGFTVCRRKIDALRFDEKEMKRIKKMDFYDK